MEVGTGCDFWRKEITESNRVKERGENLQETASNWCGELECRRREVTMEMGDQHIKYHLLVKNRLNCLFIFEKCTRESTVGTFYRHGVNNWIRILHVFDVTEGACIVCLGRQTSCYET